MAIDGIRGSELPEKTTLETGDGFVVSSNMIDGIGATSYKMSAENFLAETQNQIDAGYRIFATAAARDIAITAPTEGMMAVLLAENIITFYDGTAWIDISTHPAFTSRYVAVPTAWVTMTPLLNSWVVNGAGYAVPQYRKIGDVVELRGSIKSGTLAAALFNLPVGFRPPLNVSYGSVGAELIIGSSGDIFPQSGSNVRYSIACRFSVTA